jgi:plastocyanin
MKIEVRILAAAVVATGLGAWSCGGGGGSSPPAAPSTTPTTPASTVTTITIGANGELNPKEVRIQLNDTVRFVNNDSRAHEPQSNPHLVHTDCPALNKVGVIGPGQNRTTDPFTAEKVCGFHDHQNPDAPNLAGVIRVAGAEGPGGPIYVKH